MRKTRESRAAFSSPRSALARRCARDLLATAPAVMRFIRAEMRAQRHPALTVPQFRTLVFISVNADPSLSSLADHIGISLPAASRMVDQLVRRGLIQRRPGASDRRCLCLSLTARGASAYDSARRSAQAALARRFQSLTRDDNQQLLLALAILNRLFIVHPSATPDVGMRTPSRAVLGRDAT